MNSHGRVTKANLSVLIIAIFWAVQISRPASAQLVLYDGSVGDADPVTQGWNLNNVSGSPTVTPDAANDLARIEVDNSEDLSVALPTNLARNRSCLPAPTGRRGCPGWKRNPWPAAGAHG